MKNLYTCYDFSLKEDCANRFQIASSINENSYVSFIVHLNFMVFIINFLMRFKYHQIKGFYVLNIRDIPMNVI